MEHPSQSLWHWLISRNQGGDPALSLAGCAVIAMIALLPMPRRDVRTAPSRFDEAVEGATLREAEAAGAADS